MSNQTLSFYFFLVYLIFTVASALIAAIEAFNQNRTDIIDACIVLFGSGLIGISCNYTAFMWRFSMLYGITWTP